MTERVRLVMEIKGRKKGVHDVYSLTGHPDLAGDRSLANVAL
jgi:hypothetical protein